ncbi:MAG: hypothetical protein WDA00_04435 [Eubacteriales bacterium]
MPYPPPPYDPNRPGTPYPPSGWYYATGRDEFRCRPLSTWQYIGYFLLFSLPLVGLICMIVFAFGAEVNLNLRNLARAYLVLVLFGVLLSVIVVFLMMFVLYDIVSRAFYDSLWLSFIGRCFAG